MIPEESQKNLQMLEKRKDAASIVLNETILWVVGGFNGVSTLNSTEIISLKKPPINGPKLPISFEKHSMIQIDDSTIYLIGGKQGKYAISILWNLCFFFLVFHLFLIYFQKHIF